MIVESEDGADGPGLIVHGVRIPFQMEAHVSDEPPDDGQDDDGPWMIHLPIELEVMIPHDILYPPTATPAPPRPPSVRNGSGSAPGMDDAVPPGGGRGPAGKRPVSLQALARLHLGEALDQRAGGRPGDPLDLRGSVLTEAADSPAGPGDGTNLTTGHRAVDAVFAADGIDSLRRMLRPAVPSGQDPARPDADALARPGVG